MSDSEIITLSICGKLLGIDSESAWYSVSLGGPGTVVPSVQMVKLWQVPFQKRDLFWLQGSCPGYLGGCVTAFEITTASVDDREGLRDLVQNHLGLVILGDKGYTGEALFDDM